VPGNWPAWFGPGAAGKGPARSRHLASGLPVWRLRIHGLIRRIPHSFRYQVTTAGIRQALFLTRLTQRLLIPGLAELTDPSLPAPSRLRAAARAYEACLDDLTRQAGLAA
jgi:hypothetical protein